MWYVTAAICVFFSSVSSTEGVRCYQCDDMDLMSDCTLVKECATAQQCHVKKFALGSGQVFYDLDCIDDNMCTVLANNCTANQRAGETVLWNKCCKGDHCNIEFDVKGNIKASQELRCYTCPSVSDPRDCKHVQTCREGEECVTYEKSKHVGHLSYALGCRSKMSCSGIPGVIFGKRQVSTRCNHCCNSSYCNSNICPDVTTPTTPTTTTSTTTILTTTTTPTTTTPTTTTTTTSTSTTTTPDPLRAYSLVVTPTIQTANIGALAKFKCAFDVQVNQSVHMTWSYKNSTGSIRQIYTGSPNPAELILDIRSAAVTDSGEYICTASHGALSWTASGQFVVPGHLNITTGPQTQTVMAGSTVTLVCDVTGDPAPTIRWEVLRGLDIKNIVAGVTSVATGSRLVMTNVTSANAGFYTCVATNVFGKLEAWAVLNVTGTSGSATPTPLVTNPVVPFNGSGYHIQVIPTSVNVSSGQNTEFECKFNKPVKHDVLMRWTFNDEFGNNTLLYSGVIPQSPDLKLHLTKLDSTNSGSYICSAQILGYQWSTSGSLTVTD